MFKNAAALSPDYEYAIVYWGQSNSRPWGNKAPGFAEAPHLSMEAAGAQFFLLPPAATATATRYAASPLAQVLRVYGAVTATAWVGCELRMGLPDNPVAAYGTVTACADMQAAFTLPALTFDHTTDSITSTAHGISTGDPVILVNGGGATEPTGLAFATTYYAIFIDVDTIKLASSISNAVNLSAVSFSSNGAGAITATAQKSATISVTFTSDFTISTAGVYCWVWRDKWKSYDNVRVLTPYQPEETGGYPDGAPDVPGYSFPSSITSYETTGLFLPFTFLEGVEGPGETGVGHASTAPTDTTFTIAGTLLLAANVLAGGWIRVGGSVGKIKTHTSGASAVFTLTDDGWTGGTPTTGLDFEAFAGHKDNNPHAVTPGYGFRYPNNDPMPRGVDGGTGLLYNRPRGRLTHQHGDRFGAMLEFAWRLSLLIGKRINVIHLGINSAGQYLSPVSNAFGFQGQIGWWNDNEFRDWTPSNPSGSAARLKLMIETMAPAALRAEGSTKTLKVLGIVGSQGEADALEATVRDTYQHTLPAFYEWLRNVITTAGLSPYTNGAKLPVVHQMIRPDPYELVGTFTQYPGFIFSGDSESVVNTAIQDFAARDGFAATFDVSESPTMFTAGEGNLDPLHFSGQGEAMNGKTCAETMAPLIDTALVFGGIGGAAVLDICNLALSYLGDAGKVTALSPPDGSRQATLCARFFPLARNALLEMHRWGFAAKRVALVEITNERTEWAYAYVVPTDLMSVTYVIAEGTPDDVLRAWDATPETARDYIPAYTPCAFSLEVGADGVRVIYTNQEDAHVRYQAVVSDAAHFPPLFKMALSWHLASMLAGPLVKGDAGAAMADVCMRKMLGYLASAKATDSVQRRVTPQQKVPWITGR